MQSLPVIFRRRNKKIRPDGRMELQMQTQAYYKALIRSSLILESAFFWD